MEKNVVIEEIREIIKVETKFSVVEEPGVKSEQIQSKSLINYMEEEEILKTQLENLKKENFSLKSLIRAWKITYEQKQNELAQAESKLNKIYNELWSEREKFCERAEEFNNQYGILSERWRERMDGVFNPLSKKTNEKCQGKIEKLEMKVEDVQEKVDVLEGDKLIEIFDAEPKEADSFVLNRNEVSKELSAEPENKSEIVPSARENEIKSLSFNKAPEKLKSTEGQTNKEASEFTIPENNTERPKKKKVRFSKKNDSIKIYYENPDALKMKFFSIVDRETVRKANRLKNQRKNQLSGEVTKQRSI